MADDTRQSDEQVTAPLRAPANIMPGGTAHTAGGEKLDAPGPTYFDVVRSLGPEYYLNFHKRPCVRDSQLQGIAAGFAGGSLAAILGSKNSPSYLSQDKIVLTRQRTGAPSFKLGSSDLVRRFLCLIPGLPILPKQGEGWYQTSTRTHGEETGNH